MVRDGQGCSEMLMDAQEWSEREREREQGRQKERKRGKRGEKKDQQEAILILKKICTTQTPDLPPLAAILVFIIFILMFIFMFIFIFMSICMFRLIFVFVSIFTFISMVNLTRAESIIGGKGGESASSPQPGNRVSCLCLRCVRACVRAC